MDQQMKRVQNHPTRTDRGFRDCFPAFFRYIRPRKGTSRPWPGIPYKLFLFTIIFSPLAFGAVEPWSLFIMEVSTFTAICIMLIEHLRKKEARFYEVPGLLPLWLLLAYICFQLLPLPPEIGQGPFSGELCSLQGHGLGRRARAVGLSLDQ